MHALGLREREGGEVVLGEVAPSFDRVLLLEGGEGVGGGAVEHAGLVLADALGGDEHLLAAQASLGVVDDVDAGLRLLPQGVGVAELGVIFGGLGGGGVEAGLFHVLGELGGEGLGLAHVAALLAGVGDDAGEALEDLGVEAGGGEAGVDLGVGGLPLAVHDLERGGDAVELEEVSLVWVELLAVGVDLVVGEADVALAVLVGAEVLDAGGLLAEDVGDPVVAEVDHRVAGGLGLGDLLLARLGAGLEDPGLPGGVLALAHLGQHDRGRGARLAHGRRGDLPRGGRGLGLGRLVGLRLLGPRTGQQRRGTGGGQQTQERGAFHQGRHRDSLAA